MIRLKLGRPVVALFLSALLLSASVLPAFAASTSGQLQEVGWAETVSSFLMASGIYPFESDPETGYEEWSVSSLKALWDEFRDDTTQVAYDIVDLTGNLVKGVIAIASGRWSVLRDFATWIVNKYNVTDNQAGVELGETISAYPLVPYASSPSANFVYDNGLQMGQVSGSSRSGLSFIMSSSSASYAFGTNVSALPDSISFNVCSLASFTVYESKPGYQGARDLVSRDGHSVSTSSGGRVYIANCEYVDRDSVLATLPILPGASQTYIDIVYEFLTGGQGNDFQGITADTTTVSIPAALPEGTDFGGLAVSGTGVAATPEQLEEIVQNAVKEALKPSVAVVPVALSPDVNVSPSGEITLSGDVVIDTANIPLQSSDYSAPNLSRVFPFSIPWDVLAVLNVLDAEPVRPEFNVDLYIPILDVHVPWTIGVPDALQEPVDSFMASMRFLLLVAMCVGTLWLFWRSNL